MRELLHCVRLGKSTKKDAESILKLRMTYYGSTNKDFVCYLKSHNNTMYLFTNNAEKDKKNNHKLAKISQ